MPNYTTVIAGKGVTFSTPQPLSDAELSDHLSSIQDDMQADQPEMTATPPQGQAPPTGELQNVPPPTTLQATPNSPLSGAMERYGLQAPNFTPDTPPQQGGGTTFASDLPSIIGSVVLPMLLGGRAGGGLRGVAARTGAGVVGALAGTPIGQYVQEKVQGVPGPPLSERAINAGEGAAIAGPFAELLGLIGGKMARPLGKVPRGLTSVNEAERVGIPPSPSGITQSGIVNQLLTRRGMQKIGAGQSAGIRSQVTNKIAAGGGPLASNTLPGEFATTLKNDITTHLQRFRIPGSMEAEATRLQKLTGLDLTATTEADILRKLGSTAGQNQLGALARNVPATADTIRQGWLTHLQTALESKANAAGVVPPKVFTAEWNKLSDFSRKAIFRSDANSMSRLAKVVSQAQEAGQVAKGTAIGRTMSYWQPIAAIIGTAAALVGHSSGLSPTFLGTTAILTGAPSLFSALVQTKPGIRWLVGAIEASSKGKLTTQVAQGLTRSLVQIMGQEGASLANQNGLSTPPFSPQTLPTTPAGLSTPDAMTANRFPTRRLAP